MKKTMKLIAAVAACMLFVFTAVGCSSSSSGSSSVASSSFSSVSEPKQAAVDTNPHYVLVIGDDTWEDNKPGRADLMMLMRLDFDKHQVTLVSVPRDTKKRALSAFEQDVLALADGTVQKLGGLDDVRLQNTGVGKVLLADLLDRVGVNAIDLLENGVLLRKSSLNLQTEDLLVKKVLWIYPRGAAVTDEKAPELIAGAAGVALCLGADFVKVNPPAAVEGQTSAEGLAIASRAAGRTGLVCAGGSKADAHDFLTSLHDQIHIGGACGNATGRNIHMRSTEEAVRLTKAISAITLADYSVEDAEAVFNGEKDFTL